MHQKKMYATIGHMISTMIIQEGPPINIFQQGIVDYIVTSSVDNIQPQYCTDGRPLWVRNGKRIEAMTVN